MHKCPHFEFLKPLRQSLSRLVEMNPPKLPSGTGLERGTRMHHTRVISDQYISLLEIEIQADAAVIEHLSDQVLIVLLPIADPDLVRAELRLPLIPRLMPAHARFSICRMRLHEW